METHLWHRIRRGRLKAGRKGFSSVVGAIFMTVIVWILASSYFVWTLSQNTVYNDAIRERNQLESDIQSENVQVTNTTYVVEVDDKVDVTAIIKNTGSLGVQFVTLWIHASNENYDGHNFTQLSNVNLQGGANLTLSLNVPVEGLSPTVTYSFAAWLITARGSIVPLMEATSSNIIVSQTTQGIGALMMDFKNFAYYNVTGSPPSCYLDKYPNGGSGYYVQGATGPKGQVAFRVILTNLDSNRRTIVVGANSVLFAVFPTLGTQPRGAYWYIVNVDGSGAVSTLYNSVLLEYNVATELYFASLTPETFAPVGSSYKGIAAVNLALVGEIGSGSFGQNIPFVSINIVS